MGKKSLNRFWSKTVKGSGPLTFAVGILQGDSLFVDSCQAARGCFPVECRQGLPGFHEDGHGIVKGDPVESIRKQREVAAADSPGRGMGIAFNARDLHQAKHWVASQAKVMFQPHLRGILDLSRTSPQQLSGCRRGHGTGRAHFPLTANGGSRDRTVRFDDVSEQTGRCQSAHDIHAIAVQLCP